MKKLIIPLIVIVVALILVVVAGIMYALFAVESVGERNGIFSDETGKQLGTCTIVTTMKKVGTEPSRKTFYYDLDENLIGSCKGDSTGSMPSVTKKEPKICSTPTLQDECDRSMYPEETYALCKRAKYRCITNADLNN